MTIKNRLFLLSSIITIAVLSMLALQQYTTQRSDLLNHGVSTLLDVESDMQFLSATEQKYLLTHSNKNRDQFFEEEESLTEELHELAEIMTELKLDITPLNDIYKDLNVIVENFRELEQLVQHIGLDENKGLRGSLRNSAHQVEKVFLATGNYQLLSGILMMRRHEKDFLLRLNNKYVDKYKLTHKQLIHTIKQANLSTQDRNSVLENLNAYATLFLQLVNSKRQLGLRENDGLRGKLDNSINHALEHQTKLIQATRNKIKQARINQNNMLFIGTLLLITILVSMALLIARSVTQSLSRITDAMEHIANGHSALSATLPEKGRDETTRIAHAFNRFTAKLDNTVQQVLMVATNLSHSSIRAQDITQATSSSIEEQVEAITHLNSTIGQMADCSLKVRNSISKASETVREVKHKASEGHAVINSAVQGMQEMQAEINRLEQSINSLTSYHEDVGRVLDIIVTIAEQTNLLALNAAIEAARAGEHGRGFAVVADEVRALSQRTTDATDEVRKLMETIHSGNQEAVSLMNCSLDSSSRNMERTKDAMRAFSVIKKAVGDINDSNVQVSTLAERQSDLAIEVRTNIQQIYDSVSALSELARKNISDNGDLSQFSVQLEALVAGFTTPAQSQIETKNTQTLENVELF